MAGVVYSGERRLDKAGDQVASDLPILVRQAAPYVSRAGQKLASVAEAFKLDFTDKIVLDVGASTGGFTDFALQHCAKKVFSVDVGTGQLDWRLRQDPRVVSMEQTDIRQAELLEQPDMAVVDVSFISLTKVLLSTAKLIKPGGLIVALAKPQFEAGRVLADRFHGVIADEGVRQQILANLRDWIQNHFEIKAEAESGLAGTDGNREHFFSLTVKR
jgi:23S rRNA (cytidine1920-2'-O)/16S rRNA (cytidine1409-2'-O)-methyltransferase